MCSLFGIIDYTNSLTKFRINTILSVLSEECEIRGIDATGIAYNSYDRLSIFKRPVPASKLHFRVPSDTHVVTGHTRMTTKGSEKNNINNHPFFGIAGTTKFALAHNGVLYNDDLLKEREALPLSPIETDSYVAVQLLEKSGEVSVDSIRSMAEKLTGSFCFSILTGNNDVYLIKGSNPLYMYECNGFYIYASTKEILDNTLKRCRLKGCVPVDISPEEILKISPDGNIERSEFSLNRSFSYYGNYDHYLYDLYNCSYADHTQGSYEDLIEFAGYFGLTEDDIIILADMGYNECDIEELLYHPEELKELLEIYRKEWVEYEYFEENNIG